MSIYIYTADENNKVSSIQCTYVKPSSEACLQMSDNIIALSAFPSLAGAAKDGVRSIVLGKNVLSVADDSFNGCHNMLTLECGQFLKHIGHRAFKDNINLQSLSLPNSIEFIGNEAFSECGQIFSISFPEHDVTLGERAFYGLSRIQSLHAMVNYGSGNAVFQNATALQTADMSGALTREMFSGCVSLASVSIGSSVIPYRCFYGCQSLTSITFKQPVVSIEDEAFANCASLQAIDLSLTQINHLNSSFLFGTQVKSLVIPQTVSTLQQIDKNAFQGTSISKVQLLGFSDSYILKHKVEFTNFGSSQTITFVSSSGKEYTVNASGSGLKSTSIYVISISVNHDSAPLPGITNDTDRLQSLMQKVYPNNPSTLTFKRLVYGGKRDSSEKPTKANINACFDDALSKDPDLLVFHFSDHGSSGESSDYKSGSTSAKYYGYMMCMYGYNMSYHSLYEKLKKFKRSMAILCCCKPWYGVESPTSQRLSNASQILVWAAGTKNQDTYAEVYDCYECTTNPEAAGHNFLLAIEQVFNSSFTYDVLWKNGQHSSYWYSGGLVTPTKYNYNNFNENVRVFT